IHGRRPRPLFLDAACALGAGLLHLEYRVAEVVHALKVLVHGGETDVGDIVHLLQLAHHHLSDHAAGYLALAQSEDALLDPVDRLVDVFRGNWSFMQRAHKAGAELLAIVGDAVAARLHHHGHRELDALVGREALPARLALAPPAHAVAVLGLTRVDDRRVLGFAVRAFHRGSPALGRSDALPAARLRRAVYREAAAQFGHFHRHALDDFIVVRSVKNVRDELAEMRGFGLPTAARSHGRRADADAARHERLLGIVRYRVLVDRDVRPAERVLGVAARDVLRAKVDQQHVAVRAARNDAHPARLQGLGQGSCVGNHLLLVGAELGREGFPERDRLGGDDMHQGPALQAGEDSGVEDFLVLGAGEDQPPAHEKILNAAIFPCLQGGPLMHVIAAKAVAFREALTPEFRAYQKQVITNARTLAKTLQARGARIVSGGTDCHMLLIDLRAKNVTGRDAEDALGRAHITVNKNAIPNDPQKPFVASGIRLGSPAMTTRGCREPEAAHLGELIADVLDAPHDDKIIKRVTVEVSELCRRFPVYRAAEAGGGQRVAAA